MKKRKVMVIGLDGATWEVIQPMIEQGKLPHLASLIERGTSGNLTSVHPPVSANAWTSFATGVNAAKHGIYDFSMRRKTDYDQVPAFSFDRKHDALWNILGRHGKKVTVLRVPGTYPPEQVNGLLVSGFPTPEEQGNYTYPKELLDELSDLIDDFHLQSQVPMRDNNEEEFLEEMHRITDNLVTTTVHLMDGYEWDLLVTVFMATDGISHHFWKYLDKNHPGYQADKAQKYGEEVYRIYEKADDIIARLIAKIDEDTVVFIVSDHGSGSVYRAVFINNWLIQQGFMKLKRSFITRLRTLAFSAGFTLDNVYRIIKPLGLVRMSQGAAYRANSRLMKIAKKFFLSDADVDWSKTQAYSQGNFGQIYVNLKGREPKGIVSPSEYHAVREEIIERLKTLRDPETDHPVFELILTKEEIYNGPYMEYAPDIVFYDRDMKYIAVRLLEFGSNKLIAPHPLWSGGHKMEGVYIISGQGIKEGQKLNASICDIAPTIYHILDIPIPGSVDGKVLDIFKTGSELDRQPEYSGIETERIRQRIGEIKKSGKV